MERIPIPEKTDKELQVVLNAMMDSDFELVMLDADVSTAGGELLVNQRGFNPSSRKLFLNIENLTYSVTLTLT